MLELNKYFLQYMLTNGSINYNEGNTLLNRFADKLDVHQNSLKTVISEINEQISQQLFRIDLQTCEITGEKMCVFVNTCLDDISQSLTNYTAGEIEFFDKVLESIMLSDAKYISTIMCLNLTSRLKSHITKDSAQNKIDTWTEKGYLVKQDGNIFLGARTISEFQLYFKTQYSQRMTICKLCTDHVYYGKICAECNEVIHSHCLSKYSNNGNKCPICKNDWVEAEGRVYNDTDTEDEPDVNETMDTD